MLKSKKFLISDGETDKTLKIRNIENIQYFGYPWIEISKKIVEQYKLENIVFEDYASESDQIESDGFPTNVCYIKFNSKYILIDNSDITTLRGIDKNFDFINNRNDILFVIKRNYYKSLGDYYSSFNGKVVPFFAYPTKYFYENYDKLININTSKEYDVVALYGNSQHRTKIIDRFKQKYNKSFNYRIETNCRYKPEDYYNVILKGIISLCVQGPGLINEREMESMALGLPVIMPEPNAEMRTNIMGDTHYIKLHNKRSDFSYNNDKLIDEIYEKCVYLINDKEKIQSLIASGKKFYEENITINSLFNHFNNIYLSKI